MSRVQLQGIRKEFEEVQALRGLDLEAPDGAFLVMLGPSGCGKTTALRILAGLELPDSGSVLLGERDVTRLQPRDRDVAMVFQSYALYPHMSVRENIEYPLKLRKTAREERRRSADEVAELLEISHLLDRKPRQLSGGQRQRVALARAIVRQPQAFLMDEPLSNLDAKLRASMRGELKRLQKRLEATTVYVTHDQAEATTMADLVAVMRDGELQQVGPPLEIYDRPTNRFVATFVGNPPMNVLPAELDPDTHSVAVAGTKIPLPDERFAACARASVVEIGMRSEDLRLCAPDEEGALRGEIYVVEPLGSETLVTVRIGDSLLEVLAERGFDAPIASSVGVRPDADGACFFDAGETTVVHRSGTHGPVVPQLSETSPTTERSVQ